MAAFGRLAAFGCVPGASTALVRRQRLRRATNAARSNYEEVYLRAYDDDSVGEAHASIGRCLDF